MESTEERLSSAVSPHSYKVLSHDLMETNKAGNTTRVMRVDMWRKVVGELKPLSLAGSMCVGRGAIFKANQVAPSSIRATSGTV